MVLRCSGWKFPIWKCPIYELKVWLLKSVGVWCRKVVDEESSQNKGLNFLAECAAVRLVTQPDLAHHKWNAFKRTVRWSSFSIPLMKLTILCPLACSFLRIVGKPAYIFPEKYCDCQKKIWSRKKDSDLSFHNVHIFKGKSSIETWNRTFTGIVRSFQCCHVRWKANTQWNTNASAVPFATITRYYSAIKGFLVMLNLGNTTFCIYPVWLGRLPAGNFAHGSYLTGEKGLRRQELFQEFISGQNSEFFENLAEAISFDRDETLATESTTMNALDFISARSIKNRGVFVKNKSWFRIHSGLRQLIHDWSIVELALRCMQAWPFQFQSSGS